MIRSVATSFVFAWLAAAGLAAQTAQTPAPPASPEYKVGPGDTLQVDLPDYPDYNKVCPVQANGTIVVKGLSAIRVAGLTLLQIQDAIGREYQVKKIFTSAPAVTVLITDYGSQQVFLQGEVRAIGGLTLKRPDMTLLQAIAAAGGFTVKAGPTIEIRRRTSSGTQALPPIDRKNLMSGAIPDPVLQDRDTVIVSTAPMFFIQGKIMSPGDKVWESGLTLERAIAMAGGLTAEGSNRRVEISRIVNGKRTQVKDVNLDTLILPNDIITVNRRLA
jgi:polysaccharide export outer membrane protein